jgi:hypothetical protein
MKAQTAQTLAVFHITRGGRFFNSGHKEFFGFYTYDGIVDYLTNYHDMWDKNRDEKGRFYKTYFTDGTGNHVADYGDMIFDFDGDYDRFVLVPLNELDTDEKYIIFRDGNYIEEEVCESVDEDELREIADRMGEWKSVFNHIIRINGWNAADFGQEIED